MQGKDFPTVPDVNHYGMCSTEPATETRAVDPPWLKREDRCATHMR